MAVLIVDGSTATAIEAVFNDDKNAITESGTAGGVATILSPVMTPTGPCVGSFSSQPNHILTVPAELENVRLAISATADATLVVHGPSGFLCNDDSVGLLPTLEGTWLPGVYRIWVGSYQPGVTFPYSMQLVEVEK